MFSNLVFVKQFQQSLEDFMLVCTNQNRFIKSGRGFYSLQVSRANLVQGLFHSVSGFGHFNRHSGFTIHRGLRFVLRLKINTGQWIHFTLLFHRGLGMCMCKNKKIHRILLLCFTLTSHRDLLLCMTFTMKIGLGVMLHSDNPQSSVVAFHSHNSQSSVVWFTQTFSLILEDNRESLVTALIIRGGSQVAGLDRD